MLPTSSVDREPAVGDLIVALQPMRAWASDDRRGTEGRIIEEGQQAIILATWDVGNQRRIRACHDGDVLLFSCPNHVLSRNWLIAQELGGKP